MKSIEQIANDLVVWGSNHPDRLEAAKEGLLALDPAIYQLPQTQASAIIDLANILGEMATTE